MPIDQALIDGRDNVASALNVILNNVSSTSSSTDLKFPDVEAIDVAGDCSSIKITIVSELKPNATDVFSLNIPIYDCYQEFTKMTNHIFYVDDATGELMYGNESDPCDAVLYNCIDFCPNEYASVKLDKVVASSAATLYDNWQMTSDLQAVYNIPGSDLNEYEYGAKGKWHGKYAYDFNTGLSKMNTTGGKNWNAGIYNDFTVFNWDNEEANDAVWSKLNTTTKTSPYGLGLEEQNVLDIYSSLKMGYNFSLPYLMAVNSNYENVMFEGFESVKDDVTNIGLEDAYSISKMNGYYGGLISGIAHSGDKSLLMTFTSTVLGLTTNYESELAIKSVEANDQITNEGIDVKIWVKCDKTLDELSLKYYTYNGNAVSQFRSSTSFEKVAQVGEWILYVAKINFGTPADGSTITAPSIYMKYSKSGIIASSAPILYIDDIRMQPQDAQVTAYVYDPATFRLIASFDDQHFGLFYQYNAEGKLVRKLKETIEGIKTISETQYNIPQTATRPN